MRIGFCCGGGMMDSFNETCGNEYGMSLHNCLIYLKALPLAIVIISYANNVSCDCIMKIDRT